MRRTRWWAVGAAVGAVGGAVTATVAVLAGPGPRLRGYVSESGVGDGGVVLAYQLAFLVLAASLLLLAGALRPVRTAAALLVAAAVATAVSAAVPCREGCPLPPHDPVTAADLVHGGASVLAVACCVFAMVAIWWSAASTRSLRRLALWAVAGALPLAAAVGLTMLLIGGGLLVGALERLLLLLIVAWCVGTAVSVARDREHSDCDNYVGT